MLRKILPCLALALCASLPLLPGCREAPPDELIDLGPLPGWLLQDEQGRALGAEQLRGRPWIANFLFTSCPTQCPPLARATARLQDRLKAWLPAEGAPPVRIVSISVDPITDTPDRLAEFARKYGADPRIWSFVTGPYADMEALVTGGFMMPIVRSDRLPGQEQPAAAEQPTPLDTAHSLRFVLVDGAGHIRGLYESDEASLARLDAAARYLATHP